MERRATLFRELDATGRFHRDNALGRIFHPGTVSYRELTPVDSVHVAVTPDNQVSVHVDRISPLLVRAGRCRYAVGRAIVHNLVHLAEGMGRAFRGRRGSHNCHLDCEIVWVPDDESADEAVAEELRAG